MSVCKTTATTGEGVAELAQTIEARLASNDGSRAHSPHRMRRLLAAAAGNLLTKKLRDLDEAWLLEICDSLQRGNTDLESAAHEVLRSRRLSDE